MRGWSTWFCIGTLLCACGYAHADAPTSQPAIADSITPFITDTTFGLVRLIPARINLDLIQARDEQVIRSALSDRSAGAMLPSFQQGMSIIHQWLADFARAGGKEIDVVAFMHFAVGRNDQMPFVLVVPLEKNADVPALESLFINGEPGGSNRRIYKNANGTPDGLEAIVIHNAVVFGMIDAVEKFKTAVPTTRPALNAAWGAAGDEPLMAAFAPTFPLRMILTQSIPPTIPPGLSSGLPTIALINGLTWASASAHPPPHGELRLILQCSTPATARVWADFIDACLEEYRQIPKNPETMGDIDTNVQTMRPDLQGSRLVWNLDERHVMTIESAFLPIVVRDQGPVAPPTPVQLSMRHARQIMLAIIKFERAHGGQPPESLQDLAAIVGGDAALRQLLSSPFNTKIYPGFKYIKPPPGTVAHSQQVLVVFDAGTPPQAMNVTVGFLDGHAARMPQSQLKNLLSGFQGVR
ncbi:MAG TPA: hypothetical protein VL992_00955 [Tepidisphaeraceae bacterium]|nr:hypothetical protein [Tepidisphaeraceae bacterium]